MAQTKKLDGGGRVPHPLSEIVSYGTKSQLEGGGLGPPYPFFLKPKFFCKMGYLYFQIFGIKIDHFRGLNGTLEGQGGAGESKNGPKGGQKGVKKAQKWPF